MLKNHDENSLKSINNHQKEVDIQTRKVLALLNEENTCILRLRSVYQSLRKEIVRKQQLIEERRQMEAHKSILLCLSAEKTPQSFQRLSQLKEQCSRKQLQLKNIKQQFVSNALALNPVIKQNQSLKQQLVAKQDQYTMLKSLNAEKRKNISQMQTEIRGTTAMFKEQKLKTLKLKHDLAQLRLMKADQTSKSSIMKEIERQEVLSEEMRKIMSQLCGF